MEAVLRELVGTLMTYSDSGPMIGEHNWFYSNVTSWGEKNLREFPWRFTGDPYTVLLSEFLLRHTTSKAADRLFPIFREKHPSIRELSNSSSIEEDLKPIGLSKQRGNQIKDAASHLLSAHNGLIPSNAKDLIKIPGVGTYSASAILCFAFGESVPIIDTNVRRIVGRFRGKLRYRDRGIFDFLNAALLGRKAEVFNYALLDIGSSICRATNPKCKICPLNQRCETATAVDQSRS